MTALGAGCTDREPVTAFNGKPGRSNLVGQQKPDYLIDAIENEKKAWTKFAAVPDTMTGTTRARRLFHAWQRADNILKASYKRHNEEMENENHA